MLRVITLVQAWRTTEAELVSLNGCRSVSKEIPSCFLFVLEDWRTEQLRRFRCVPLRKQVRKSSNVVYHVYHISHSDWAAIEQINDLPTNGVDDASKVCRVRPPQHLVSQPSHQFG